MADLVLVNRAMKLALHQQPFCVVPNFDTVEGAGSNLVDCAQANPKNPNQTLHRKKEDPVRTLHAQENSRYYSPEDAKTRSLVIFNEPKKATSGGGHKGG